MKVKDVMSRNPTCCTADCSLESIARIMADRDCGAIPIVGDLATRFPLGIVTDRDIVLRAVACGRNPAMLMARDCMTAPPLTISEDADLKSCIELLEERQIRRIVVVDLAGRIVGIVAQADIATSASKRQAGELLREVSRSVDVTPHV